ncbi:LLM class flavin-dependent oxidoreductase [Cereibacter azotoformans]|uniref:Luciferase-like monooxygenase n=1 Tax=Cereibacter azotoformans TaxID=43057 RepID=A0A2T5JP12_9RHOB|nr:LLM class flavin-dependent oxidoreductase [Cereibacter azotoformans]AXQ94588.1 LLM class flavin-dependent oxidoreductase [Cereibacter sphaeroides]MBO4170572.1 LLM class flavin-dependent oxidoreductase [Cereibacter azotoformans]PTR09198.1 luciferase family oxidoreductase group 1 [Cereibacter azotoformans]UIJ30142.1 LLM class flavin-dependent oxidoreductase [Cereibacter azotoformans]
MIPYSVLDLAPVPEGATIAAALGQTTELARHAEALGYSRFWLAEHHAMPGIASAATAVLIGHVAAHTSRIRVGSGGIMLPNHAPLMVAEAFGTLATLHPDRIDLGLGRAPGTDARTAQALRRNLDVTDNFPADVLELQRYFGEAEPGAIQAVPGEGTRVPIWILGSSLYGAQLAAHFGLPYAFASHFAPPALETALAAYRQTFRPSPELDRPRSMIAINIFAGADDDEGRYLRSSAQLAFANLRSGRPGKLPRPVEDIAAHVEPAMLRLVDQALAVSATGGPETVRRQLAELIERHRPDEVIFTGQIHDPEARRRSFTIAAEAMASL